MEKSASSMPASMSAPSAAFASRGVRATMASVAPSTLRWTLAPSRASSSLAASSSRAGIRPAPRAGIPSPSRPSARGCVPSAIFLPWSMTAMRAASWSASSRYCVVSRMVTPEPASCADHAPHALARHRIEPRRRLVEEQHARRHDERGRDVQPAAHAARIILDLFGRRLRQIEGGQQLVGALARAAPAKTPQPRQQHQVLAAREVFVERGELPRHRDLGAHLAAAPAPGRGP